MMDKKIINKSGLHKISSDPLKPAKSLCGDSPRRMGNMSGKPLPHSCIGAKE